MSIQPPLPSLQRLSATPLVLGTQVLTTRVYRGLPPSPEADAGIEFVALDGTATLARVAAYEMRSIWKAEAAAAAAAAAAAEAAAEAAEEAAELASVLSAPPTPHSEKAPSTAATPRAGSAAAQAMGRRPLERVPSLLLYGGGGGDGRLPSEFWDEAAAAAVLLPEEELTADIFLDLMP